MSARNLTPGQAAGMVTVLRAVAAVAPAKCEVVVRVRACGLGFVRWNARGVTVHHMAHEEKYPDLDAFAKAYGVMQ